MKPTAETFAAWNEGMSRKYNPDKYHNGSNLLLNFMEGRRTNAILKNLGIRPEDAVLDIGCGAGNMLQRIRAVRTGIDLSETMIARSRAKLGSDVTLIRMSAEHLEFEDGSFDKIICSEVIEHVLNPRIVLQEIARVLKPAGLASISIPNESLIEKTKWLLRRCGLRVLMKNDGETNLDEIENEWHLHRGSLATFRKWNDGVLLITRVCRTPVRVLPFRYVFLLRKGRA